MKNPFKFGSIVDTPYFIDRQEEIERVKSYLASENHLIIISPRRFGTIFSSLKRLTLNSLVIKTDSGYEIDDPLFKRWLIKRRQT